MKGHFPVDAEARGKVRALKAKLTKQFDKTETLLRSVELYKLSERIHHTRGKGNDRARVKIMKALGSGAELERAWPYRLLFVGFRPTTIPMLENPGPSDQQSSILTMFFMIGDLGRIKGPYSIQFKDHALGRLFQRDRSLTIAGAERALLAAHRYALKIDERIIEDQQRDRFWIPAGNGAFGCDFVCGTFPDREDERTFFIRAATWLHADMLDDNQRPAELGGVTLGERFFQPSPLRLITFAGDSDDGGWFTDVTVMPDAMSPTARMQLD